jgi:hypothetical protein
MGTPAYMAPEQARGELADERADVYALGAILYHLLSGEVPYADSTPSEVLNRVIDEPPTPLRELEPKVAPDLLAIVSKAMARQAGDRYPTAKQLAQDLRRFETGQLVSVRDYSMAELLRRWLSRHRAVVAMVLLLVVTAAVGGYIAVSQVVSERDRAEVERGRAENQRRAAAAARQAEEKRRLEAEQAHEEAVRAQKEAEAARKEAQNAAEMLVDAWVQSRFAGGIRNCYRRGKRGKDLPLDAVLRLKVTAEGAVEHAEAVHEFGTAADACIIAQSRKWRFPPGTPVREYDLTMAVDPESHDVQVGFIVADVDSIRRTIERRYRIGLRLCYQELLRSKPGASGAVTLALTVGEQGQIALGDVDVFDPDMRACIDKLIGRWRFPPPRDASGANAVVTFESSEQLEAPREPVARKEAGKPIALSPECLANPLDPSCTEEQEDAADEPYRDPIEELDMSIVRRYIRRRLKAIRYCYTKQLGRHPGLRGTLHTSFTIASNGKVIAARATGLNEDVANCVAAELESIVFPRLPDGGATVVEDYPFHFRPADK